MGQGRATVPNRRVSMTGLLAEQQSGQQYPFGRPGVAGVAATTRDRMLRHSEPFRGYKWLVEARREAAANRPPGHDAAGRFQLSNRARHLAPDYCPVLVSLVDPNRDRSSREVDTLDLQPHTLHQPDAGGVEQPGHQPVYPRHVDPRAFHIVTGENRWKSLRLHGAVELTELARLASHHSIVNEGDGVQDLMLRCQRNRAINSQMRQECSDCPGSHLTERVFCC